MSRAVVEPAERRSARRSTAAPAARRAARRRRRDRGRRPASRSAMPAPRPPLVTGGSGIALGLPANFIARRASRRQGRCPQARSTAPGGPRRLLLDGDARARSRVHPPDIRRCEIEREAVIDGAVTPEALPPSCAGARAAGAARLFLGRARRGRAAPGRARARGDAARCSTRSSPRLAARLVDAASGASSSPAARPRAPSSSALGAGPCHRAGDRPRRPAIAPPRDAPLALALKSGNFGGAGLLRQGVKCAVLLILRCERAARASKDAPCRRGVASCVLRGSGLRPEHLSMRAVVLI